MKAAMLSIRPEWCEKIASGMPVNKELVKLVKNVLLDVVRKVNSGQLVEVVRCKDCIGQSTWFKDAETGCEICGMSGMYPKGEFDFCSYGERKDGDGNG